MKLAIKGHPTRGDEVIELLEMLGGKNTYKLTGDIPCVSYAIGLSHEIYVLGDLRPNISKFILYTLEEFETKFPYKVKDVVQCIDDDEKKYEIVSMRWTGSKIKYDAYGLNCINNLYSYDVEKLKPYKGVDLNKLQTMLDNVLEKETSETLNEFMDKRNMLNCSFSQIGKITAVCIQDTNYENKVEIQLDNYAIIEENGKWYAVKKKPQYPKNYKECCKALGISENIDVKGYRWELLMALQELIICRDAYWKIAGDWKPTWNTPEEQYCIVNINSKVVFYPATTLGKILTFPTEEMRDAFYENYKNLIESCKELL